MRRSVLASLSPSVGRAVGAPVAALVTAGLGWFVGASTARSAVAAVAVAALVLLLRTAEPVETGWPEPPGRRTRPGWHVVAGAQRALEGARTDRDDRRAVQHRLDALQAQGTDPRIDAARAAVGLPAAGPRTGTVTTRTPR